jgi:hypothetical protein
MEELILEKPLKAFLKKEDAKNFLQELSEEIRQKTIKSSDANSTILEIYKSEADYVQNHYLPDTFWQRFYDIPSLKEGSIQKLNDMRERIKPNDLTIDHVLALLPDL